MMADEERHARECLKTFGEWRRLFGQVGAANVITEEDQRRSNTLLLSAIVEYDAYVLAGILAPPEPEVY